MPAPPCITRHLEEFRETKHVLPLAKAIVQVVKQKRTMELMYGWYCRLFHRPSPVCPGGEEVVRSILERKNEFARFGRLSRRDLTELYGEEFAVRSLPDDLKWTRCESVWREDGRLIVGEYGEHARIACVTSRSCEVSDYYGSIPGVRHIHSLQKYGTAGEFLVATGDRHKVLDLWVASEAGIGFVRRVRKHLAGFTAAVEVNGEYFFGSDFSHRPNFIETLGGAKYFFPDKAYTFHAAAFFPCLDRFIVAINKQLDLSGGRKTLSVFDVVRKEFIFCDYVDF
jgi:hypothetical protein